MFNLKQKSLLKTESKGGKSGKTGIPTASATAVAAGKTLDVSKVVDKWV